MTAVGFSENQRGELLETEVAHQMTSGGGKPGQGYQAVRIAPTLSTKNEVASSSTQRDRWMAQSAEMLGLVRRLTPTECERLQGFPDGWSQLGKTPDSKRYAALGDAVTVNVAEWLGHRLLAAQAGYEPDEATGLAGHPDGNGERW